MNPRSYEIYHVIGEGSFGKVYKARFRETNELVAYKVISKNGRKPAEVFMLRKECEIQKNLQHPNIIRMIYSFETDNELVVITEFAQKDLCRVLKQEGVFPENKVKKVLRDLIAALYYLHSNRVLHRDLKPQNVLLDANETAKLCDFGFAKSLGRDLLTSIKGTPLYMAPELMNESPYDHRVDLWSLGCIGYELLTGHTPYSTTSIVQLIQMVRMKPIQWPTHLSEVCLSFLKGLLQKNPLERLTWPYILHHPFIAQAFFPLVTDYNRMNSWNPLPATAYNFMPIQPPLTNVPYCPTSTRTTPSNKLSTDSMASAYSKSNNTIESNPDDSSNDPSFLAQKEEWSEFLKKNIEDVMYSADTDVLTEKPSFMLIMKAFNDCKKCPTVVTTVCRLLSLPFVVESISESQLSAIKENYLHCSVMHDLVKIMKEMIVEMLPKKETDSSRETALQHLLLLICNLTFVDKSFLKQFFECCITLRVFQIIKSILSMRTRNEPLSIVKYFVSITLRLYMVIPDSRKMIVPPLLDCVQEFQAILQESNDVTVQTRLCTLITILGITEPNFHSKVNGNENLIDALNKLKLDCSLPSVQQATDGMLEVLKK
ncbi:probable serine/threonine-protein kinase tsuA [Planococcus citri]|uniref:probable serine/threonine-protein kinase tsuA n=1 Tax=Planococcus citri TaxID=170843 RepID=UPI0031F9C9E7